MNRVERSFFEIVLKVAVDQWVKPLTRNKRIFFSRRFKQQFKGNNMNIRSITKYFEKLFFFVYSNRRYPFRYSRNAILSNCVLEWNEHIKSMTFIQIECFNIFLLYCNTQYNII